MKTMLREATWYAIASLCALCVDAGLLWIFVNFVSMNYLLAATISFMCGVTVTYVLSITWVFRYHRLRDRRAEFAGFVALGLPGLALNAGVISVAVRYFGLHYLWAKGAAAVATFSWNFLARRQILFLRK
jgi:putative flippase GtrA